MSTPPPLAQRLHTWLYEQEPRLSGTLDMRAVGETLGALGINMGTLLGLALASEGEASLEATLAALVEQLRTTARSTADRLQEIA